LAHDRALTFSRYTIMSEYLIRRTDGEWFDLPVSRFHEALRPSSFPAERIEGWGDYRIQVEGVEIAFSYEDPGIHVNIEGALPAQVADRIVNEIRENIERVTGQQGHIIALG
jgi:hypothetical protein